MKTTDINFAVGEILLTGGLIISSIGARWSFFTGLALVIISGSFSLRTTRPKNFAGWMIRTVLWMAGLTFLIWFSSFGSEKPPIAALIGAWFGCSVDEFRAWRQSRSFT